MRYQYSMDVRVSSTAIHSTTRSRFHIRPCAKSKVMVCATSWASWSLQELSWSREHRVRSIMNYHAHNLTVRVTEFSVKLVLYDPTNYGSSGLRVTLFDKSERGLPKVDAGDILMLRSIQVGSKDQTAA